MPESESESAANQPSAATTAGAPTGWRQRLATRQADLLALAAYAVLAGWLFAHLITGVHTHYLSDSNSDQRAFEYYFTWVAKAVTHGTNPFFLPIMNAPFGVNGMGNTVVYALSIPLTPITLWLGATTSFTLALVLGMTASGWAWYWLFSRVLSPGGRPVSRLAAAIGGGLVAFSPAMVSQANGHVNMVVNFALPAIIGLTLRLRERAHRVRRGLLLGLFAIIQVMTGAEILLVTALGFGIFLIAYGVQRPAEIRAAWRGVAIGLAIAVAVTLPVVAYPIWFQFYGPQHYDGLPFTHYGYNDIMSYVNFPTHSLGGGRGAPGPYNQKNVTEENSFFGWPLVVLTIGLVWWFRRSVLARAAAVTGAVFAVFSLGERIHFQTRYTGIPGPWRAIAKLPLMGNIIPSRLAFVVLPMIAILIILATERIRELLPKARAVGIPLRALWLGTLAVALVPLLPTPLPVVVRPATPAFFSDGTWRQYVDQGGTVVAVPLTRSPTNAYAFDWQRAAGLDFDIAGGYFLGPWPADEHGPDGHGWYDQKARPTDLFLAQVQKTGPLPVVTTADQANAREDLRYWHAQALVMDPGTAPQPALLKLLVDKLFGVTGQSVDGVVVWEVRDLSGA